MLISIIIERTPFIQCEFVLLKLASSAEKNTPKICLMNCQQLLVGAFVLKDKVGDFEEAGTRGTKDRRKNAG